MKRKPIAKGVGIALLIAVFLYGIPTASNTGNWSDAHKVLQTATFNQTEVTIHNIRNFTHTKNTTTKDYYTQTYNINELETLWFIVEPFSQNSAFAHTFVSFGFKNGEYVTISVESRRGPGEDFSAIKGMLKQYELMYVIASEWDQLTLRAVQYGSDVYVYPISVPTDVIQQLFVTMVERANQLAAKPEFYNTFTKNCTNSIMQHILQITGYKLPFSLNNYIPGFADQVAHSVGIIKLESNFKTGKQQFNLASKIHTTPNADFSRSIRKSE